MALEELALEADRENMKTRDKLIGVYVGILAVILAICSMGGSNAEQDALQQNIAAANTWGLFPGEERASPRPSATSGRLRCDAEDVAVDAGRCKEDARSKDCRLQGPG